MGEDEVDGLADGQDLRGLLVGHPDAVGVLELLDERVEVERVGLEVLLEARVLVDARRIEVELVGEVRRIRAKTSSRVMAADTLERCADGCRVSAGRRRAAQRAGGLERGVRAADDVPAHAARGQQDRLGDAAAREAPVRHDAEPAQAEQVGAARRLGVDLVAELAQRRAQQQRRRPSRAARTWPRRGSRRSIVCETPSISFSATLPVKPSVTTTSAAPAVTSLPSTLPTNSRCRAAASAVAQQRVGLQDERRALRRLLAVGQQADARALDAEHRLRERRAHEGELDEVLGPHLGVGADVERASPARPGTGTEIASAGR